jgi:2-oxoisovalerate ferredoxin oxidoreductase alpha subunit
VYVLTDGLLGQMVEPLRFPETAVAPTPDASWAVCGTAETSKNFVSSIELDFDKLEQNNIVLQAKYASMAVEADWEEYLLDGAELVFVAYGCCARVAKSCAEALRAEGVKAGMLRLKTLFPFPAEPLKKIAARSSKPVFVAVEMSNGQMIDDVRLAVDSARPVLLANRMGGNVITAEEVLSVARNAAKLIGKESK